MATNMTNSLNTIPNALWHSPVPYLLGGLCAMLALIAAALIILALSHFNKSYDGEQNNQEGNISIEDGEKSGNTKLSHCEDKMEESVIVIMAGDENPSFLATPTTLPNHIQINRLEMEV
ncbi:hypothetical protein SUGI_0896060 [Cryptomeria japonica]|nr:hypothetical protein SUGI_0896060 [Cryptomeria japonica]